MLSENLKILESNIAELDGVFISFINEISSYDVLKLYLDIKEKNIDVCCVIHSDSSYTLRTFIDVCIEFRNIYPNYSFETVVFEEDEITKGFSPSANLVLAKVG